MSKPFRWDVARREQLGGYSSGRAELPYPELVQDLRRCAARVIAFSSDADLVFVGRSPESLFDYLSGVLAPTSWGERLTLLNLSLRGADHWERVRPAARAALREHLEALDSDSEQLARRPRPIAFVDLVATGTTLGRLAGLVLAWARQQRVDETAVRRKLRFVGITWRAKTSPKTWRWHQHVEWVREFPKSAVKNVSIPGRLWSYLGNYQNKLAPSNPEFRWDDPKMARPPRGAEHIVALWLAVHLYDLGQTPAERECFASALASEELGMRERWYRALLGALKRAGSKS